MSLGRSFHRIMARGRKLLSVDFLLTTGTGYDNFLKLFILEVDIVSGKRDDKSEAQWPIGYGVGLRIKRSSVRIRLWPLR